MNTNEHANVVRDEYDYLQPTPRARAALAALVKEIERLTIKCDDTERARKAERSGRKAAEAERDEALSSVAILREGMERQKRGADNAVYHCEAAEMAWREHYSHWKERAERVEAERNEAREALAEIHHLVQMRRTSLHMDGTEVFTQPILAQINNIARAYFTGKSNVKV